MFKSSGSLPIARHVSCSIRKHAARSAFVSRMHQAWSAACLPAFLINRAWANGLNRQEFESVTRQAGQWQHLQQAYANMAAAVHEKALYWDGLGLPARAAAHYVQSALWNFYAHLVVARDDNARALHYSRCYQSYRRAAQFFDYPASAVEIPYQSGSLKGYLRCPASYELRKFACVILINSINSSKEELHYTENAFLRREIATLSFDLPGSGESQDFSLETCDFEHLAKSLYLFAGQQTAIDEKRLAMYGSGIGGSLALKLALSCPQGFIAVAVLSAPCNLDKTLAGLLPTMRREAWTLTNGAEDILPDLAGRLAGKDELAQLSCPLLVASGGRDILTPPADTHKLYELAGSRDKKLIFMPQSRHGCYEMMPSLRHDIAQWISQRL